MNVLANFYILDTRGTRDGGNAAWSKWFYLGR